MIELRVEELVLTGVTKDQLASKFPTYDLIRQIERYGILEFMTKTSKLFTGRVLDFGSGSQPYRHLVSGEYVPCEKGDVIYGTFDCIICNQVLQYVDDPKKVIELFDDRLRAKGHLVMTYATNWDEVEASDLHRITMAGMERLLLNYGFRILHHERRSQVSFRNFKFPLGYSLVAQVHD